MASTHIFRQVTVYAAEDELELWQGEAMGPLPGAKQLAGLL
jgi:hypothetical protein